MPSVRFDGRLPRLQLRAQPLLEPRRRKVLLPLAFGGCIRFCVAVVRSRIAIDEAHCWTWGTFREAYWRLPQLLAVAVPIPAVPYLATTATVTREQAAAGGTLDIACGLGRRAGSWRPGAVVRVHVRQRALTWLPK